jgi:hypothetical protein
MKNAAKCRSPKRVWEFKIVKREAIPLPKSENENPLTVLGNPALGVYHLAMDGIPQFVTKGSQNHPERVPFVVIDEIFDVFKNKDRRAMGFKKTGHLKEQGSLGLAEESVRASEGVLFRDSGNGKGLAGKSRDQNIIGWNIFWTDIPDVPGKRVVSRKIGLIGFPGLFIPFAGEDAFSAGRFEPEPHSTNAGEQVDKPEGRIPIYFSSIVFFRYFSQILENGGLGNRFSLFPANDGSVAVTKSGGYFPLGEVQSFPKDFDFFRNSHASDSLENT